MYYLRTRVHTLYHVRLFTFGSKNSNQSKPEMPVVLMINTRTRRMLNATVIFVHNVELVDQRLHE